MMRRLAAAILACVAGCGMDPATGVLPSGVEAITYNDPDDPLLRGLDTSRTKDIVGLGVGEGNGESGLSVEIVDVGVKVRVTHDPGPGAEDDRAVQVRVMEGQHANRVGTVGRKHLRPVPR